VQASQHTQVLADAAAGLSHQLEAHLVWLAEALRTRLPRLDRQFRQRLKALGHDRPQCESLMEITPGAAARSLTAGEPLAAYLERVQYRGRRLAKLGLTPVSVVAALREYDVLMESEVAARFPGHARDMEWVRNQLHFLVILTLNNAFYHVREAESQAFYELFRAELESRALGEMLERFLAVLAVYTGAQVARIYLVDEKGGWAEAARHPSGESSVPEIPKAGLAALAAPRCILLSGKNAHLVLDSKWKGRYATCWSVPLSDGPGLHGVLQFGFERDYEWLPRETDLLQAAAERCWQAAEKARLAEDLRLREEQVRRLAEHMVEVEESERRRISRELHDEAGQSMLCIRLQLEMLEQEVSEADAPWRAKLTEVREVTEHTIIEIRRLIAALSPAILEQMGLAAAIRQLVARFRRLHQAEVRIQIPRKLELPKRVEIIVYRLVQEILNNVAKYSLANHVNLLMESADGCLRLSVEDDGVGFDVDEAFSRRDCYGLSGLRERVALLGGTLAVDSLPKTATVKSAGKSAKAGQIGIDRRGTAIRVELPLTDTTTGVGGRRAAKRSR